MYYVPGWRRTRMPRDSSFPEIRFLWAPRKIGAQFIALLRFRKIVAETALLKKKKEFFSFWLFGNALSGRNFEQQESRVTPRRYSPEAFFSSLAIPIEDPTHDRFISARRGARLRYHQYGEFPAWGGLQPRGTSTISFRVHFFRPRFYASSHIFDAFERSNSARQKMKMYRDLWKKRYQHFFQVEARRILITGVYYIWYVQLLFYNCSPMVNFGVLHSFQVTHFAALLRYKPGLHWQPM